MAKNWEPMCSADARPVPQVTGREMAISGVRSSAEVCPAPWLSDPMASRQPLRAYLQGSAVEQDGVSSISGPFDAARNEFALNDKEDAYLRFIEDAIAEGERQSQPLRDSPLRNCPQVGQTCANMSCQMMLRGRSSGSTRAQTTRPAFRLPRNREH